MTDITFTDAAIDDLRKIGPSAVPKVLKKLLLLLDSPRVGYPLGGDLTGFRKLVVGCNTWRIVYRLANAKTVEIYEIGALGARADAEVYAEATARVEGTEGQRTEFRALADVIERLGRLAGEVTAPRSTGRDPVPDWLARRLIHTIGMTPQDVAALSLEEAVDRWGNFMSKPPGISQADLGPETGDVERLQNSARVRHRETVDVTEHGRLIARIIPVVERAPVPVLERLADSGRVTLARRAGYRSRMRPGDGTDGLSDAVAGLRDEARW